MHGYMQSAPDTDWQDRSQPYNYGHYCHVATPCAYKHKHTCNKLTHACLHTHICTVTHTHGHTLKQLPANTHILSSNSNVIVSVQACGLFFFTSR